jgi:hypothetical protein
MRAFIVPKMLDRLTPLTHGLRVGVQALLIAVYAAAATH